MQTPIYYAPNKTRAFLMDYPQQMKNVLNDTTKFTRLDDKFYEIDNAERKVINEIKTLTDDDLSDEANAENLKPWIIYANNVLITKHA